MLCEYALSNHQLLNLFDYGNSVSHMDISIYLKGDIRFGYDFYKEEHRRIKVPYTLTIRFLSSEDEDDFLSL